MSDSVTVQVTCVPVWAQQGVVKALTGVPDNVLRRLSNEGRVRAKKMDAAKANSATVFRVQDVLDWLEEEAPAAPRYAV
jgi:hypothetical protein